jgi:protein-L-isoaspartate(D-aspartate) O-methyltransferase
MTDLTWRQYTIAADHDRALTVARTHLVPVLTAHQDAGWVADWWYLRKPPGWRWRCRADPAADRRLRKLLATLAATGHIDGWTAAIYEPETEAFGGPDAMEIAHRLFHHDSRALLTRAGQPTEAIKLGRRETTVVLLATMHRAAGLDWFEQGATWAYAADQLRPDANDHDVAALAEQVPAMRTLMQANPT